MSLTTQIASLRFAIRGHERGAVVALLRDHPDLLRSPAARGLLHEAVRTGNAEAAGELLRRGADARAVDDAGQTPLHLAAHAGDLGLVTLLLEHGADPLSEDPAGLTPAGAAEQGGHAFCTRLIDEALRGPLRRGIVLNGEEHWGALPSPGTAPPERPSSGAGAVAVALRWPGF